MKPVSCFWYCVCLVVLLFFGGYVCSVSIFSALLCFGWYALCCCSVLLFVVAKCFVVCLRFVS